jgi:hypothetical protein
MPDPITNQLLDKIWSDIQGAVASGRSSARAMASTTWASSKIAEPGASG